MKKIAFCILFLVLRVISFAQDYSFILHPYMYSIFEEKYSQEYFENLNHYLLNPIDLNNTTKDELSGLGLLDLQQIENLLFYLYTNGEINNMGELRLVEGFDYNLINLIKPYLIIKPLINKSSKKIFVKQTLIFKSHISFPFRDGYAAKTDSLLYANKKYFGDPLSFAFKYNISLNNGYSWGILAEKDPGERFKALPDYLSFYFSIDGKNILKRFVVGDFKVNISQGLIINNGFTLNAMMDNSFRKLKAIPIRKHNSWNESDYLRGAASYFEFKNHSLTTFISYKNMSTSIKDSLIVSINKSGLHRSFTEIQNKKNITESIYGLSWSTYFSKARIDFSILYTKFSMSANRLLNTFEKYSFNGNHNMNYSFGWSFNNSIFYFRGEEAISKSGGVAFTNYIQLKPINELFITVGQRYYSPKYHSFYGKSFGFSSLNNEEGYLFKLDYQPFSRIVISACFDFFRIPLMKASSPFPSNGYNAYFNCNYSINALFDIKFRYKRNLKEKEEKEDLDDSDCFVLLESYKDTYQFSLTSKMTDSFFAFTGFDYSFQSGSAEKKDQGFHVSQTIKWIYKNIDLVAALSVYYSDRGNISFYSVNKQISTGVLFSRLSGSGYKTGTSVRWNINKNCKISVSYSYLKARNKDSLYSGINLLPYNYENMLSIYYSWRF